MEIAHGHRDYRRNMRMLSIFIFLSLSKLIMTEINLKSWDELDYAKLSFILNPGEEPPFDPLDFQSDIREGDVIDEKRIRRNALRDGRALWRSKTIPYVLNTHLSPRARQAVLDAIADYDTYTCIRFVPRDPKKHSDYVEFIRDKGCYSYVGRNGGRQTLSLGEGCEVKGIAIHEMMHVVGFMHEQSRSDRDSFVTVLYQNIPRKLWDQFDKMKTRQENNLGALYDYNSVMHYSRKAFTANGRDTLLPKIDGATIGQRRGFSTVDVQKINNLYGCTDQAITGAPSSIIDPHSKIIDQETTLSPTDHFERTTSPQSITPPTTTESGDDEETDQPSIAIGTGCINRRNRLYCDLKKSMGWCKKSSTVAFDHCPLTCGTCNWRQIKTPAPPTTNIGEGVVIPIDHKNNTGNLTENEDCQGDTCCDKWKNCFEFHCYLYSKFCSKTCGLCSSSSN